MRYALMTEPQQGMSYADQLAAAKRAEANGFDTFFRSDHFASFPGPAGKPTTDAWTVLAGLARETERIGLGVLVSPVTFRHPGVFAKVVMTVDEMSGGRVEAGVGAGWNDDEHRELGLAFPPLSERADLLEDELAILNGLWGEPDGWSFTVSPASASRSPVPTPRRRCARSPADALGRGRPRIIVGSAGTPRSYRLAARYADEYNLSSASPSRFVEVGRELDAACAAIGRDPSSLARSTMAGVLVGRDATEVKAREEALLELFGPSDVEEGEAWLETRRTRWVYGTPDDARAQLTRFAEAGVQRIMLQDFLPWDLAMIDVMGEELVGRA